MQIVKSLITSVLIALYQPFWYAVLSAVLLCFLYLYAYHPINSGKGLRAAFRAWVKEFKTSCIDKGKVLFYPGSDLRKLCKTLDYTLYKSDSSADSDKDPLPDDGDDNQGGSGSGVTPDPSV